jgi:hypothetical protein
LSVVAKRQQGGLVLVVSAVLLTLFLAAPGAASASSAKNCGSVVKKIFALNEGPPFYKAKVLITSGEVPCSEARRIIWKALQPGGFNARIQDWVCRAKGLYDPFIEKCERGSGASREVIKSSKPKPCASCARTAKRVSLANQSRWKNCGLFLFEEGRFVKTEAKRVGCKEATRVARGFVSAYRRNTLNCSNAGTCHVAGFTCDVDTLRDKFLCTRDKEPVERFRFRVIGRQ